MNYTLIKPCKEPSLEAMLLMGSARSTLCSFLQTSEETLATLDLRVTLHYSLPKILSLQSTAQHYAACIKECKSHRHYVKS